MSHQCHSTLALLANVDWTAWEIPSDKVQGLGYTLGDGVNMVIAGKFTTDVQAEVFCTVDSRQWSIM